MKSQVNDDDDDFEVVPSGQGKLMAVESASDSSSESSSSSSEDSSRKARQTKVN